MISDFIALDEESREYLETIHASSESLLNILDDILDYAKLNSKNSKRLTYSIYRSGG